jgi:hypothetical protein
MTWASGPQSRLETTVIGLDPVVAGELSSTPQLRPAAAEGIGERWPWDSGGAGQSREPEQAAAAAGAGRADQGPGLPAGRRADRRGLRSIEAEFASVCGGRLCVKLVIRPADADPESCGFQRTDPPAGTTVQRDTTVALVCTPAPTEPSDSTPRTAPTRRRTPPHPTTASRQPAPDRSPPMTTSQPAGQPGAAAATPSADGRPGQLGGQPQAGAQLDSGPSAVPPASGSPSWPSWSARSWPRPPC